MTPTNFKRQLSKSISALCLCAGAAIGVLVPNGASHALVRSAHYLGLCVDVDENTIGQHPAVVSACHGRNSQHFRMQWLAVSEKRRLGLPDDAPAAIFRLGQTAWCLETRADQVTDLYPIPITKVGCDKPTVGENVWLAHSVGGTRYRIRGSGNGSQMCLTVRFEGARGPVIGLGSCQETPGLLAIDTHFAQFWWLEQ